jgi:hypothetical protein
MNVRSKKEIDATEKSPSEVRLIHGIAQRISELFEVEDFDELTDPSSDPQIEGFDESACVNYFMLCSLSH